MALTVEQLINGKVYKHLETLNHKEIVAFIKRHSKDRNLINNAYLLINMAILMYTIGKAYYAIQYQNAHAFDDVLAGTGLGFFLTIFVSFFIHETIHLIAYKILGAKKTSIKIDFKKFVFLAIADQFVMGRKAFYFLAILPFAVITTLLLAGLIILNGYVHFVLLGILILHTAGCSGDFALISYFYKNKHLEIYTYDDIQKGESYFYQKI